MSGTNTETNAYRQGNVRAGHDLHEFFTKHRTSLDGFMKHEQRGRTGRHWHGIARLSIVDLSIDFLPGCGFTINVDGTVQLFELLSRPEDLYCRRFCE